MTEENLDLFEQKPPQKTQDQILEEWKNNWLAVENKTAEQLFIAFVEEHKCKPSEVEIVRIVSADNYECRIFMRKRESITL